MTLDAPSNAECYNKELPISYIVKSCELVFVLQFVQQIEVEFIFVHTKTNVSLNTLLKHTQI